MTQAREDFVRPASEETIQRVAQRMRERNIEVVVVDDGAQAHPPICPAVGGCPGPQGHEHRIVCGQDPAHRTGVGERSNDRDPGPQANRDLGEPLANRRG